MGYKAASLLLQVKKSQFHVFLLSELNFHGAVVLHESVSF